MATRFRIAGSMPSTCSEPSGVRASANWMKRWCLKAVRATPSCSALVRGGLKRSRTIACWCRPRPAAFAKLIDEHSLDQNAAENLLRYLEEQASATGRVPGDRDIVVERCHDELGDWRICVLSPFGTRVHAPWCMAAMAKLRAERGIDAEAMWNDDGFVIRLPESEEPLETEWLIPSAAELKDLVLRQLGSTSMFAAKFRESAARALLLPKRRP